MRLLILLIFILNSAVSNSQVIMSWNIQNLGETKYKREGVIIEISNVIKNSNADIIAIQEVTTGRYGDSCIIKISNILNYNYIISNRTTGIGSERYAFIWKKDIRLNWSRLDIDIEKYIEREPYIASFKYKGKDIVVKQVHLVPQNKKPENEVLYLLNSNNDIICGDFNLKCKNLIFSKFLENYYMPLCVSPTTLKRDGLLTNNDYDHFIVNNKIKIKWSKVYYYNFSKNRNFLSDHLPILISL
jgi:deoxyribonuclease-1-like protein